MIDLIAIVLLLLFVFSMITDVSVKWMSKYLNDIILSLPIQGPSMSLQLFDKNYYLGFRVIVGKDPKFYQESCG